VAKVLICTQSYYPYSNGVAEVTTNLAEQLVKNGHQVTVATEAHPRRDKKVKVNGVSIISFDITGSYLSSVSGSDIDKYVEFVRSFSCDIINVHCAQIWVFDLLIGALHDIGKRTIFTSHGLSLIHNPIFKKYQPQFETGLESFTDIICLSELLDDYKFYKLNYQTKLKVIPNGVDVVRLEKLAASAQTDEFKKGDPYIINVSNHNPAKNHSLFFEIAALSGKRGFVNVGGGHVANRFKIAKSLGIKSGCYYPCTLKAMFQKNVTLFKNVSRPALLSLLKRSKIFLFTSSVEQFPIAILEAMAFGIPWISTEVGNLKNLEGGITFTDAHDAIRKIENLLADEERYRDLSAQGKKAVTERYNWIRIAEKYEELFLSKSELSY
jgi:glycosyltransferase involved in cell wall biosynthesis